MKHLIAVLSLSAMGWTSQVVALEAADLTPFGAERKGNADGSIPDYTGEAIAVPPCYNQSEPNYYCDPWNDKPLFSITAQNLAQYAERLTDGQKSLFSKYPEFRMDIYPSRRTARLPDYVLENTRKNLTSCRTTVDGTKLEGCYGGIPFPQPKNGHEIMWNHLLKYTPVNQLGKVKSILVDSTGRRILLGEQNIWGTRFFNDPENNGPRASDSLYAGVRVAVYAPVRRNGEQTMVLQDLSGRQRAYQYLPGQRRVKLAPDLAYDTPSPVSGGVATMDQQELFYGQLDRYDFEYLGKQERFIIYNNFAGSDYKRCPEETYFTRHYPNPDCTRWELHRVRVVEAKLKPGFRHIMPKRMFYFDEDLSMAGTADGYNTTGQLSRIDNMMTFPLYAYGYGNLTNNTITIDLERNSYGVSAFGGFSGGGYQVVDRFPASAWSPENMVGRSVR
ncbi:MAG: DUF1329 domain-containing protein, partial [Pseudomonadaceae bacterium]